MADPYNVDDILNEIKKGHGNDEEEKKAKPEDDDFGDLLGSIDDIEDNILKTAEQQTDDILSKDINIEIPAEDDEEAATEAATEEAAEENAETEQDKAPTEGEGENTEDAAGEENEAEGPAQNEAPNGDAEAENGEEAKETAENSVKSETFTDEEQVDLLELSANGKKKPKWRKTKKGKIFTTIIIILVVVVVLLAALLGVYGYSLLAGLTDDEEVASIREWTGMDTYETSFDPVYESSSVSSYRDMVKQWYYSGTPCYSSHVLNVLLIGEHQSLADAVILASLNQDTGEITLTSILRDSYCYFELTEGDESTGQFGKINAALSLGGMDCYIRCVEHMFKISIDNYVEVGFDGFSKIIDAIGGIDIEMTDAEIKEINNHQKRYGNVTIEGGAGLKHLNGKQALAYCRIRHIDSDSVRADRQKTVLLELFEEAQNQSAYNISKSVRTFLPYVKTGYSSSNLVSMGTYALTNNWLSYDINSYTAPSNDGFTDEEGNFLTTCKGGTYYGAWIWKVDYPLLSQAMQENIYKQTNITLAEYRPNFATLSDY